LKNKEIFISHFFSEMTSPDNLKTLVAISKVPLEIQYSIFGGFDPGM